MSSGISRSILHDLYEEMQLHAMWLKKQQQAHRNTPYLRSSKQVRIHVDMDVPYNIYEHTGAW